MTGKGTFVRHCETIFILFVLGSMIASWLTFCSWLAFRAGEPEFIVIGFMLAITLPLLLFVVVLGLAGLYSAVYQAGCDDDGPDTGSGPMD